MTRYRRKQFKGCRPRRLGVLRLLALLVLLGAGPAWAATEAGTRILNQAAATYVDLNGVLRDTNSNQVQTLIRQVGGLSLVDSQNKPSVPGGQVLFPHVLTNTGNGPDSFELCVAPPTGAFAFDSIGVFADANGDGLPDSSTQVADLDADSCFDFGPLSAGESVNFVIGAVVPDLVATGQTASFELTAISDFDNSIDQTNTDSVTLIDGPVIEVVKSLSSSSGYAGTGGYQVIIEYRNVGTETATDLVISDVLPVQATDGSSGDLGLGMIYTAGTAEWQQGPANDLVAASIDPLTDAGDADVQSSNGINVIYCAYDASCVAPPFGDSQVSIAVDSVPVGGIGRVEFGFSIDDGYLRGSVLPNTAVFEFSSADGLTDFGAYTSNTASLVIIDEAQAPAVVANDSDVSAALGVNDSLDTNNLVDIASASQGQPLLFSNFVWNTAPAGLDTFDILIDPANDRLGSPLGSNAFPAGTRFTLLHSDGNTPLQDTNGNGVPDTGPVDAGEFFEVVLRVDMPLGISGNNGGNGWQVTKIARSGVDPSLTNAVTDRVQTVVAGSVDLTNDAGGLTGAGAGPEPAPVTSLSIEPNSSGTFVLAVENTGGQPDAYFLEFSSQLPFSAGTLPAGWSVSLFLDGGAQDCSSLAGELSGATVVLPGAANRTIFCAQVSIAGQTVPVAAQDLYFRVRSEATGVSDIKRDAVTVPAVPALLLEFDQTGQVEPGGTVTYPHVISNIGNQPLECVNVALLDSLAGDGWTSQIYLDVDSSGSLSAGDVPLTDQTLAIGASARIIVRTFAPSTAPFGVINSADVTATGHPVGSGCASPVESAVVDRTTTTATDMVITKKQAIDVNCDGVVDGAPSNNDPSANFSLASFSVLPGECVVYRLDAINQGVAMLYNAVVRDVVPSFTTYLAAAQQCVSADAAPCNFVSPPANGATLAPVTVESAEVLPGGRVTVFFGIRVE